MDELASRCKEKLLTFRLKELKDVLSRVRLARHGKKQVLIERIMALLSPPDQQGYKCNGGGLKKHTVDMEEVAKIIDDIFRKMQGSGAPDLASKARNVQKSQAIVHNEKYDEPSLPETRTRCPCGSSIDDGTMIQCDDNKCGVWQHLSCVVIPEKAGEEVQTEIPSIFYCEVCRINRADPFCETMAHPVLPTRLTTSFVSGEGSSPLQNVEKPFVLTRSDRDLLQRPGYDLQVWCILLNDTVLFRMQWPQYADLRVNGVNVRVTNRPGPQLLGFNGRDDSAGIIAYSREGTNKVSLSAYDARQFCMGVRIVKRRTSEQVLRLVPHETEGEPLEEALARVRRCIGGGGSLENSEDGDSDLEVVSDSVTVNLRCPMSGSRIRVAGRFKPCEHMGCFDLQSLIELTQHTRKWQCPICLKNFSLENIVIDQYFSRIASVMKNYPEDVCEVEVKPDASWRPKLEGEARSHQQWRLPDGSLPITNGDAQNEPQILKLVKQEDHISESHNVLRIGMKRNRDGDWELNGAKDNQTSSNAYQKKEKKLRKTQQYSSATRSNGDHQDPSVNQEASQCQDNLVDNGPDCDSALLGLVCPTSSLVNPVCSDLPREPDVIVLSDSEEEIGDGLNIGSQAASRFCGSDNHVQGGLATLNTSETLPEGNGFSFIHSSFSMHPMPLSEVSSVPYNANAHFDLFGANDVELNPPHWPVHSQNATFQLFGTQGDASDTSANSQNSSVVRSMPARHNDASHQQANSLSGSSLPDYAQMSDSRPDYLTTAVNGDLIENSRGIGNGDAPLELLFSDVPAQGTVQDDTSEPVNASDSLNTNWISLSLGIGIKDGTCTRENCVGEWNRQKNTDERSGLDSLANTALDIINNANQLGSVENCGSESPSIAHRCSRPICPQLCLPVDSDSE